MDIPHLTKTLVIDSYLVHSTIGTHRKHTIQPVGKTQG